MSATKRKLNRAYLGLGSNIEPEKNLPKAVGLLKQHGKIKAISNAWQTEAVGSNGPNFLNAAILLLTPLSASTLKSTVLQPIEVALGRTRNSNINAPRTIDLDILLFNDELFENELWDYAHLAIPLAEILPNLKSSKTGLTLAQAASSHLETNFAQSNPSLLLK